MTEVVVTVGFLSFLICFTIVVYFLLRNRGQILYLWLLKAPEYFTRAKISRPLRVRWNKERITSLTPDFIDVMDHLIYDIDEKIGTKTKKADVADEVLKRWENIKLKKSKCVVWLYRFKKAWNVKRLGEKGTIVYAYCPFSTEEITKRFGRRDVALVRFSDVPLFVHSPSVDQYIHEQVTQMQLNGEDVTEQQVKNLRKDYKFDRKGAYLATLLLPVPLNEVEDSVEDRVGFFNNVLKIIMFGMDSLKEKMANYNVMKYTLKNVLKVLHETEVTLHTLQDSIGYDNLELNSAITRIKQQKMSINFSPLHEPLPSAPEKKFVLNNGPMSNAKKALSNLDGIDYMVWIMVAMGIAFLIFGGVCLVVGNAQGVPLAVIGLLLVAIFLPLQIWRSKDNSLLKYLPSKKKEQKQEVQQSSEGVSNE